MQKSKFNEQHLHQPRPICLRYYSNGKTFFHYSFPPDYPDKEGELDTEPRPIMKITKQIETENHPGISKQNLSETEHYIDKNRHDFKNEKPKQENDINENVSHQHKNHHLQELRRIVNPQ
ncbi:unnamed protein product [Clavelina lepadiformis]|uniref:Uncharacterized protein n=1 Tax=Clavelina lepadiformis TaxID=159417 RepID=A0ABP0FYC8_CLALP